MAAAALFGYAAATIVMMWPFVNLGALGSASYPGDARLMLWTLAWDNHAVLDGLPLFDANVFYPASSALAFNDHLFGISLFTLPVYAATRNPVLAYNLIWLITPLLNGLAMHALAWRQTRNHLAAATAGLAFAFSFYTMHHAHGHLSLIWLWLIPLSLWQLDRWLERPTLPGAALWTAMVVLEILASWYLAVLIVVANAIAIGWRAVTDLKMRWLVRTWQLALGALIAAVLVWPFAERYQQLPTPSVGEVRSFSADWASYVVPPENTVVGQWWLQHIGAGPRSLWGEQTLFFGWIALLLGTIGAVTIVRQRAWRAAGGYVVLLVAAVLLSFGPTLGDNGEGFSLFGMLARLPGVNGFRVPARFAALAVLALAMIAAYGIQGLQSRFGRRGVWIVIGLLPLMLGEWRVIGLAPPQPEPIPAIYRSPQLQNARALVSLPDYRGRANWVLGADYLYYSTAHWRPIVNGYGRSEPEDFMHVISHMDAFPGPNNANTMRQLGVEYVVLHAARLPDPGPYIRDALALGEYDLVEHIGSDYLFRVRARDE